MNGRVLYCPGLNCEGLPTVCGLWTLHCQDGFPLEMSAIECRHRGLVPDWFEAMLDASTRNELPALWRALQTSLSVEDQLQLKLRLCVAATSGKTYEDLLAEKRASAVRFEKWVEDGLAK